MHSVLTLNASPAIRTATLAGGGLQVLPCRTITSRTVGEPCAWLVRRLTDWRLPSGGVHVVNPLTRFCQPKVTAFGGLLSERVKPPS